MESSSRPDWRSSLTGAADPLQATARLRPDAPALVGPVRGWSYRELDHAAAALARALVRAGVRPGERVGILAGAGPDAVIATHAVPRAGGTVVHLHPRWTDPELRACAEALGLARIVADAESAGRAPGVPLLSLPLPDPGTTPGDLPAPRDPAEEHSVVWTSGTTGRPRGVALSALNHVASAVAVADRLQLRPGDRWALSLHPAHVGGLALVLRAAAVGSVVVAPGPLSGETLADLVNRGHVTHASLVPLQLRRLLAARGDEPAPQSLRVLLVGGDVTPAPLLEEALARGYPVALTYGLTEATSQVATAPPALVRRQPGTVGPPLGGVEVRLDADGGILVRGPTVMLGYVGGDAPAAVQDGWLETGDHGRLDPEGYLWITGRRRTQIVSGGVNVDPAEVEAALQAHPRVADAIVLGLPDPEWGERVVAAVTAAGEAGDLASELEAFARERLAPAKRPRRIVVLADLPRNPNGKVDLRRLRGLLTPGGERG